MRLALVSLLVVGSLALGLVSAQGGSGSLRGRLRQMIHRGSGGAPSRDHGAAEDGTYHGGTLLHCGDCHVMHGSKDGQAYGGSMPNPTGYPKLLKGANGMEACLTCHDGKAGTPDVVGADVNGLTQRAGGMFAAVGVDNPNGHKLADSGVDLCIRCHTFGHPSANKYVTCTDCHDPHGNGRARNLQWASYPEGTPPLGLFVDPGAAGLTRYEESHVAYGTDGTDNLREVTNVCIDCHHVFSGSWNVDPDGDGIPNKHPVTETERAAVVRVSDGDARGTTSSSHWVTGAGAGFDAPRVRFLVDPADSYSAASTVSPNNTVFCLTCHRAHGSDHPAGVVWAPGNGGAGPSGCDQCHNKSSS